MTGFDVSISVLDLDSVISWTNASKRSLNFKMSDKRTTKIGGSFIRFIPEWFMVVGFSLAVTLIATACQKLPLDEDGGYFNEKTGRYKYVFPKKKGTRDSELKVQQPRAGVMQQIRGDAVKMGDDLKSVWVHIRDRQSYMILAERLSAGNREDKGKNIRIQLKYVSPLGSVLKTGKFRTQWEAYVSQVFRQQFIKKMVFFDIDYEEKSRKFWGDMSMVVETDQGERIRSINLWMVTEGLSYYLIDRGKAPNHNEFIEGQRYARKLKKGIWKYQ